MCAKPIFFASVTGRACRKGNDRQRSLACKRKRGTARVVLKFARGSCVRILFGVWCVRSCVQHTARIMGADRVARPPRKRDTIMTQSAALRFQYAPQPPLSCGGGSGGLVASRFERQVCVRCVRVLICALFGAYSHGSARRRRVRCLNFWRSAIANAKVLAGPLHHPAPPPKWPR